MNNLNSSSNRQFNVSDFIAKYKYLIAFMIFVCYLSLSMFKIGQNSLWYDEIYSIDVAKESIKDIIKNYIKEDVNPPLYLIILHYWMNLFGESETALRSLSAVSVSLASAIFFLFANRFFNWQAAIFSVLLFFTSNEIYYYSEEGRTYGLIILSCTLSLYTFMNFVEKPSIVSALVLGIINSIIFHLHTIASLFFLSQIIMIFILAFDKNLFDKKEKYPRSFFGYQLKHIVYYLISWIVFTVLFLIYRERFFELVFETKGGFWLAKPSIEEFYKCLYEFHNSKEMFLVLTGLSLFSLLIMIIFKKYRDTSFNYKMLLLALIAGPFLMCFNYYISIHSTPVFLKRYILFTLLGFILSYSYIFSVFKINFKLKISVILILCGFLANKMIVPRESWFDFEDGVTFLKKVENKRTYISTDMPALYAYYLDKETIFNSENKAARFKILSKHGVFMQSGDLNWPNKLDYSKYDDIYYTRIFDAYYDPEKQVEKQLKSRLIFIEEIPIKGIQISHYKVPVNKDSVITTLKQYIRNDKSWFEKIIIKAKERNISLDSMITLDAIWSYEQKYNAK